MADQNPSTSGGGAGDGQSGAASAGGGTPKGFVPESDFLAVKKGAEQRESKLATEFNTVRDSLLKTQADYEKLQEQVKTYEPIVKEHETTKATLAAAHERGEKLAARVLELSRERIVQIYGVAPETVKDKAEADLKSFEDALKAVGNKGRKPGSGYAMGGGGGGSGEQSPQDRAKSAIAEAKKRLYAPADAE